jgi:hypothetical protein
VVTNGALGTLDNGAEVWRCAQLQITQRIERRQGANETGLTSETRAPVRLVGAGCGFSASPSTRVTPGELPGGGAMAVGGYLLALRHDREGWRLFLVQIPN